MKIKLKMKTLVKKAETLYQLRQEVCKEIKTQLKALPIGYAHQSEEIRWALAKIHRGYFSEVTSRKLVTIAKALAETRK